MKTVLYALILLVGFLVGLGFAVVLFVNVQSGFIAWLYRWQTLVGGFFALIAGAATVAVVVWQTRVTARGTQLLLATENNARKDNLRRKRVATRAVLPADLFEICTFTKQCAAEIKVAVVYLRNGLPERPTLRKPELPERVIANLQNLIEHLDQSEADTVAEMLSLYQVFSSRFNGTVARFNGTLHDGMILHANSANSTIEACVELHLRAESMFDFARRRADALESMRLSEELIYGAYRTLDLYEVMTKTDRDLLAEMLLGEA